MLTEAAPSVPLIRATDAAALKPIFTRELSSAWGRPLSIGDFFVPRVQARGGGRFLVQYRFITREEEREREWIFWGRVGFGSTAGDDGRVFSIPELELVVPIFPFDPDLPALERFFPPEAAAGLLPVLRSGLTNRPRIDDVRVLGYRLGRRAVLRVGLVDGGGPGLALVAKLLPPRKVARLELLMKHLASWGFAGGGGDAIRMPRVLASSPEGVLWLEEHPEPPLHDLIGRPSFLPGCAGAARALRRLNATPALGLPAWSARDELERLRRSIADISEVFPDLGVRLGRVLRLLEKGVPGPPPAAVTLHRDFHDKQVLTGAGGTTLLDVDTMAVGDPALDVGNFLAHLVVRAGQAPASAALIADGGKAFLAQYGPVAEARRRWWEAASLLRLSCVYALRPRWHSLAVPLLGESQERLLPSGGSHA